MNEEQFFIERATGAFPDGAWFFELHYPADADIDEETSKRKIGIFRLAVFTAISLNRRMRPKVLTRTRKSSIGAKMRYTHFILCSRCHELTRHEIERLWTRFTGGAARSELLHTRYVAERRARAIAKYYLPDQKEVHHEQHCSP